MTTNMVAASALLWVLLSLTARAADVDNNIGPVIAFAPPGLQDQPRRGVSVGPAYVVDIGPQRPHGQGPSAPVDLGPQRSHGQLADDLGPQRPQGQLPPDLGPQRPHGQFADDLGPQRPFGQLPPDVGPQRPQGQAPPEVAVLVLRDDASAAADLSPHRPSGLTDPNGPPGSNGNPGPQRPAGQAPPRRMAVPPRQNDDDAAFAVGPHRPAGELDPNGPKGANGDLGPHRPQGAKDPNLPPGLQDASWPAIPHGAGQPAPPPPLDLGPQRPSGQFPPAPPHAEDDDAGRPAFRVFWNVPSFMCHRHRLPFANLTGRFGIVQNDDDVFRGTRIAILYDPGLYPALVEKDGKVFPRNGGVPQEGNLALHLQRLQQSIEEQVPKDINGLGVIDFEAWRPVWAQNFGTLRAYQTYSIQVERQKSPGTSERDLQARAKQRFEAAAKEFFLESLRLAQRLRPNARWGYYAFPYCFNTNSNNFDCSDNLRVQNSQIQWLFDASTALYPSVYLSKRGRSADDEFLFVSSKLREAARVARGRNIVYPYLWYRYRDAGFLSDDDLRSCLALPRGLGMAGAIIWGSSSDMNTRAKCQALDEHLDSHLGPTVRKYAVTLSDRRVREYMQQRNASASASRQSSDEDQGQSAAAIAYPEVEY